MTTKPPGRSGFRPQPVVLLLAATALSGGSGYIATWMVAATVPAVDYAQFAVFWSAVFLVIGALGGVQQETTRATVQVSPEEPRALGRARAASFAVGVAIVAAVIIAASAPLWAVSAFSSTPTEFVIAIVVGASSYVLVAFLAGTLYGLRFWTSVAVMIAADGTLRLGLIATVLAVRPDPVMLAWSTVLPFPVVFLVVFFLILPRLRGRTVLDIGVSAFARNAGRAMLGTLATAVMLSGFPFLLSVTTPQSAGDLLPPVILVLTLTRAPLVVPIMALQSYLIVRFSEGPSTAFGRMIRLQGILLIVSLTLAIIAAFVGPGLLRSAFGSDYIISGSFMAAIIGSSGVLAALSVSGPAALAASKHSIFAVGWSAAAVLSAAALLLPTGFEERTTIALFIGPTVGVAIHVIGLHFASFRQGGATS